MTAGRRSHLAEWLDAIGEWLWDEHVSDITINEVTESGPGRVWVKRSDSPQMVEFEVPGVTRGWLQRVAELAAHATDQQVNSKTPLLSAELPFGAPGPRLQVVLPPVAHQGGALAIRKRTMFRRLTLKNYVDAGAFSRTKRAEEERLSEEDGRLLALYQQGDFGSFLAAAVRARKTILISGGTGSGKTQLAMALALEFGAEERIIVAEDVWEVKLEQQNALYMVASAGGQGVAQVELGDLVTAALRLYPRRIVVGELRTAPSVTAFLRAVNSGHPGSIATIHANACVEVPSRLAEMLGRPSDPLLLKYFERSIDVLVHWVDEDGFRHAPEVRFNQAAGGLFG